MSSTNRGNKREASDYYVTPVNVILDFLMEFNNDFTELSFIDPDKIVLDPCAGGDSVRGMSYPDAINKYENPPHIRTIDIRGDSKAKIKEAKRIERPKK